MRTIAILVVLLAAAPLMGCAAAPITSAAAAATAQAGGCWPYGVHQPPPPSPPPVTATPRLQPDTPPPPPTATPVGTPWVIYPTCTPAPSTPTVTPPPTATRPPIPPPTPQPPAAVSAMQELQDALGVVRERGLAWTYNDRADGPVVAWIAFGWRPDEGPDGQVWVTSRDAGGIWRDPQQINPAPVVRTYGGLGLAAAPDGTLRLLYGSGDPDTVSIVYEVVSHDDGATWTPPQAVMRGSVQAVRADRRGGWHALVIGPAPFEDRLWYGVASGNGGWTWMALDAAPDAYRADLAILELHGRVTPVVITTRAGTETNPAPHVHLYRRDGGRWLRASMPPLPPGAVSNPTIRPTVAAMSRGDGLVVAAWSNYGSGMTLALVSTDGGRTFGPAEILAQHHPDGAISPDDDYGVEPSLAYDPESDVVLASWNEIETGAGPIYPWPVRSMLARRPLDAAPGQPWLDAVTPATVQHPRRILDPQRRAYLVATPDGAHAGLLIIDERNYQARVSYRDVHLPALASMTES